MQNSHHKVFCKVIQRRARMSKAMENYLNKRKIIVDSAKILFLGKGYTATSMDKVAEKSGLTKQTVYRYFPSKADLFRATLEAVASGDKKEYVFGDGELRTELLAFGKVFLTFHMTRERLNVFRLVVAEGLNDKELSRTFFETRPKINGFGMLIPFLEKQRPLSGDPEFLGTLFFEMLLSLRTPVLLGIKKMPSKTEMASHVEKVVDFFLAGCNFTQ